MRISFIAICTTIALTDLVFADPHVQTLQTTTQNMVQISETAPIQHPTDKHPDHSRKKEHHLQRKELLTHKKELLERKRARQLHNKAEQLKHRKEQHDKQRHNKKLVSDHNQQHDHATIID